MGDIISRRGLVVSTELGAELTVIEAEVPLANTFGFSTDLRGLTQGQGTFTMEFKKYAKVPGNVQEEVIAARKELANA